MLADAAITVCVNYDDYLANTLPGNRHLFNEYYVITDSNNEKQLRPLVDQHKCHLVVTDSFYYGGSAFNKSLAINQILPQLEGWVCHLDADIILPADLTIDCRKLSKDTAYGIDRFMCPSLDEFKLYMSDETRALSWELSVDFGLIVDKELAPLADRVVSFLKKHPELSTSSNYLTYIPIGYFQLFYTEGSLRYPTKSDTAALSDLFLGTLFDNQEKLPYTCIHLPVIEGESSDNWRGRKTPRFEI